MRFCRSSSFCVFYDTLINKVTFMDLGMTWWLMLIAAKSAPSKLVLKFYILLGSGENRY